MLVPRVQQILSAMRQNGQLSQAQIHRLLSFRKNTISTDVTELVKLRLIRACGSQALKRGRPRTVLEIDPKSRHVIGLSIQAGRIEICRLNLRGDLLEPPVRASTQSARKRIATAARLIEKNRSQATFAIGAAIPGLLDLEKRQIILSVLDPVKRYQSIQPLVKAVGRTPFIVENDVHAMSAKWLLLNNSVARGMTILVFIADGQIGSALLIDGRPAPGCLIGAHELGHTRFNVATRRCYCGHVGCLESIFSSAHLRDTTGEKRSLGDLFADYQDHETTVEPLMKFLAYGIANMVNFLRPHRLILVSDILAAPVATAGLIDRIRDAVLRPLQAAVDIQVWTQPAPRSAETAGWLALAAIYEPGWVNLVSRA
jgi:predicted NBD/HSP70 family sugar kinase